MRETPWQPEFVYNHLYVIQRRFRLLEHLYYLTGRRPFVCRIADYLGDHAVTVFCLTYVCGGNVEIEGNSLFFRPDEIGSPSPLECSGNSRACPFEYPDNLPFPSPLVLNSGDHTVII